MANDTLRLALKISSLLLASWIVILTPSIGFPEAFSIDDNYLLEMMGLPPNEVREYYTEYHAVVPFKFEQKRLSLKDKIQGKSVFDRDRKIGRVKSVRRIRWEPQTHFVYRATIETYADLQLTPDVMHYFWVSSEKPIIRGKKCEKKPKTGQLRKQLPKMIEKEFNLMKIGDPFWGMTINSIFSSIDHVNVKGISRTYGETCEALDDSCQEYLYGGLFCLRLEVSGKRKDPEDPFWEFDKYEWIKEKNSFVIDRGVVTLIAIARKKIIEKVVFKDNKYDHYEGVFYPTFVIDIDKDGVNEVILKEDRVADARFRIFRPKEKTFLKHVGWAGYH